MHKEALHIIWDETSKDRWTGLMTLVPNSCYLHSWGYGEALHKHTNVIPRRGIIYRSVTPIGLVQAFQEKTLFGKKTKIIRGPQWIQNRTAATDEEKAQSLGIIKAFFDQGLGSSFQILPELEDSPHNRQMMEDLGFKLVDKGLTTNYLDLAQDLDHLKKDIDPQWLESLELAEKRDLKIYFGDDFRSMEWLLEKYEESRKKYKFNGPTADFIRCFLLNNEKPMFVAKVVVIEPAMAGALVITHGMSATYYLAWSSAEGLEKNANHLLLWKSIERLQRMGIQSMDLNGIDMKDAHGLRHVKEGLSTHEQLLVGNFS